MSSLKRVVTISLPSKNGHKFIFYGKILTEIDGVLALESSHLLQIFVIFDQIAGFLVEDDDISILQDLEIDERIDMLANLHHTVLVAHFLEDLQLLLTTVYKSAIIADLDSSQVNIWQ